MADSGKQENLAVICRVSEVRDIPGADRVRHARVGGWWTVVVKDSLRPGDLCLFIEVDSWLPKNPVWDFLAKSGVKRMPDGAEGYRLKTVTLRGALSQGLALPLNPLLFPDLPAEGTDVTGLLGVRRWEAPEAADLSCEFVGDRPEWVPYTDQPRVQNLWEGSAESLTKAWGISVTPLQIGGMWEVSEKLDGMSVSVYAKRGPDEVVKYGVCSRGKEIRESAANSLWRAAREQEVLATLADIAAIDGRSLVIQGELCGPGIQSNRLGLAKPTFYVFDVWDIDSGCYMHPYDRSDLCVAYGLLTVPVLGILPITDFASVDDVLRFADNETGVQEARKGAAREGVVFRSRQIYEGKTRSFKAVSNRYLKEEKS